MNKKGFTLIEVLLVILIIGILTSVALPQYQKAVVKAKTFRLLPLLRAIDSAEQVYFLANGNYTDKFADLDITLPQGNSSSTATHLYYEDSACFIRFAAADNPLTYSAYCHSSDSMAPRIEKYFSRPTFLCWYDKNNFSQAVCAGIAGSKQNTYYSYYEF